MTDLDDWVREVHALQQDWSLVITEGLSCGHIFEAAHGDDVSGPGNLCTMQKYAFRYQRVAATAQALEWPDHTACLSLALKIDYS